MAVAARENSEFQIQRVMEKNVLAESRDFLAVEEPLEIRLGIFENGRARHQSISITMRTPGNDEELAVGFLFTEGIISSRKDVASVINCGANKRTNLPSNTVRVNLAKSAKVDLKKLERNFYTTSSCGVCGKTSLEILAAEVKEIERRDFPQISTNIIHQLPEKLGQAQTVFAATGGLHAAALFDAKGKLIDLREDVGRHNAVDKLVGRQFLNGRIPLADKILMVSGRASFELVQKALMGRIPVMAAVGAPSSLAVAAAREFGMTLCGFVRDNRFNIYAGAERIVE